MSDHLRQARNELSDTLGRDGRPTHEETIPPTDQEVALSRSGRGLSRRQEELLTELEAVSTKRPREPRKGAAK